MVRWPQRSGQEDTVVWAASEKQQSTSFFRPYCVVVVMGPGGTCWGSFRGTCDHCVTGSVFLCVA